MFWDHPFVWHFVVPSIFFTAVAATIRAVWLIVWYWSISKLIGPDRRSSLVVPSLGIAIGYFIGIVMFLAWGWAVGGWVIVALARPHDAWAWLYLATGGFCVVLPFSPPAGEAGFDAIHEGACRDRDGLAWALLVERFLVPAGSLIVYVLTLMFGPPA
jgi:hypothetical protein